ncbi:MAG: hypothetical protein PHC62_03840 [Candidatus Izemoplasmatales bacterium]|nr:hypothetical protein [Candidatus Izemoplasmatales bacterium]
MASYSDYNNNGFIYYLRPGLAGQNQAGNYSTVRSHAYLYCPQWISWTSGSFSNHVWSGGLGTKYASGTHLIHYGDFNLGHDSGGVFPGAYIGGGISTTFMLSGNCAMSLERGEYATIPRASSIDSFTKAADYLNTTYTYKYTPKLSTYYNRLRVSIVNVKQIFTTNLGAKTASQQSGTFTFSAAQLKLILDAINATDGTVTIGCVIETYSDVNYSSKVGESTELKLAMNIPTTITSSNPTVRDSTAAVTAITGNSAYIVQDKSNLTIVVPTSSVADCASTTKPATIKKYQVTINNTTKELTSAGTIDFGIISNNSNISAKLVITDSRGNKKEVAFTINVLPYSVPKVEIKKCYRSKSDGTDDAVTGTYFTVLAEFSVQSIKIGGVEKNTISEKSIKLGAVVKSTSFNSGVAIAMSGVGTGEYAVTVSIKDKFGSLTEAPSTVRMAIVPICVDLIKNSVGIGMIPTESNCLEIGFDYLKFGKTKINATHFSKTLRKK